jgi:hypothetical protein
MKRHTLYGIAYHSAGVLIAFFIVAYVVRSALFVEVTAPCSTRYPAGMLFTLQTSDGVLMSPAQLQARVGLPERGVMENTKVVPVSQGPSRTALEVKLANVADMEEDDAEPKNGLEFRWRPPGMSTAQAACLSYDLWLPKTFEFGRGGVLPGIFGGTPDLNSVFATRVAWNDMSEVSVNVESSSGKAYGIGRHEMAFAPGRWVTIEQEVVLNSPGKLDGTVRLWVDGELRAENTKIAMRADENSNISGVLSDVGYTRRSKTVSTIRLSPFKMSWR